jgi:hypothetical protein
MSIDRRRAFGMIGGGVVVAGLGAVGPGRHVRAAAQTVAEECATPEPPYEGPNLYELNGPSLTVTYSTSSIVGEPQLNLSDTSGQHSFAGETILVERTLLGWLVSVELAVMPDSGTERFSLLLPDVSQVAVAPDIAALAIYTTERSSLIGPAGVEGAIQSYRVVEVTGVARSVVF